MNWAYIRVWMEMRYSCKKEMVFLRGTTTKFTQLVLNLTYETSYQLYVISNNFEIYYVYYNIWS